MSEGTILKYQNNTGQIKGDDGKTYAFNRRAIQQGSVEDATPGRRVRFQPDDDRAREVALLAEVVATTQEKPPPADAVQLPASGPRPSAAPQKSAMRSTGGPYRFLNPYNFVRTLEVCTRTAAPLLGRCAPPPHDRYIGQSGRITCRLTTTTPLFVSDSEGVEPEEVNGKTHLHYRFFRDPAGNVAIPGTGLRGAIRSVFEAATNSCFAHFAGGKRLSYHLPPGDALRLAPARVRKIGDGQWQLELLPGTTPINPHQRPSGPQYAAWVPVYTPLWASRATVKAPNTPYAARKKLSLQNYHHGETCQAIIELVEHPLRRFEFWNVVHLAKAGQPLPRPGGNQRVVNGYLCITNQNIENKHDERLFFTSQPLPPVDLPAPVRKKYEELIADYQERHGSEVQKRRKPAQPQAREAAFSRFILERAGKNEPKLADGDLVYAMLNRQPGGSFGVEFIVPVSVPRVGFNRALKELLHPSETTKCEDYQALCPACRTFGWVWGDDDETKTSPDTTKPTAYAGRVRFSHAHLIHDAGVFDSTLAILSTPKPTTYRFYLRPKNGKPQDGLSDERVDYDAGSQSLRGRKVYRHHGDRLNPQEYQSVNGAKSDQNRSVHGVQKAGSVFEFTVDFENLAPVELGALLWSLRMEGWNHRLGYGKPLGFGSAQIEIIDVKTMEPVVRYASLLDPSGGWKEQRVALEEWTKVFKKAMAERYGAAFESLPNIRDLKALLADTPPLPVHYPRPTITPQAEGRQYEWFVGNKRSGQDAGPRLALPLAEDDHAGLPLIDKYGDIQG